MFDNENNNLSEHLVTINRVAKVVKAVNILLLGFAAIFAIRASLPAGPNPGGRHQCLRGKSPMS